LIRGIWIVLGLTLIPASVFSQNLLSNPEHVAYDPLNQRYLVPDFDGNKVTFFTGVYSGIDRFLFGAFPVSFTKNVLANR
jgi:hypothetical protein